MKVLKSKSFWTAMIDAVAKILALVVGKFYPQQAQFVNELWLALQPVALALVAAFLSDDLAVKVAFLVHNVK